VFPTASNSIESNIDNPNFGYDVEADRLLQILQSTEIRDSVVKKFNLTAHFGIDINDIDWMDKLNKKYKKYIEFVRTPYMSIEITAQTSSPEMSADLVNFITKVVDKVRDRIYKQNVYYAVEALEGEFKRQLKTVDQLRHVINEDLERNGMSGMILIAGGSQMNVDFNDLLSKGKGNNTSALGENLIKYRFEMNKLNEIGTKLERARLQIKTPIPSIYIVDPAKPSYKKVFPSYLVNGLIGFFGAAAICILWLLILDKYKWLRDNL
jgi:capsular polysaccharide biosynthesis protein